MKAIFCPKYGPPEVLQLKEVEKPVPENNEILVKNYATAVTSSDCIARGYKPIWRLSGILLLYMLGFFKPRKPLMGSMFAGTVESVGKDVKKFKKGDKVFGSKHGSYAQYVCVSEEGRVSLKPSNLTYEEAVAIPYGGLLALHYLRKGKIKKGQKVLIYGASGATGSSAVQLAKYFGTDVTGVCSTTNLELVKSLGADKVLDYTKEDFTLKGGSFDLIFDAVPYFAANRWKIKRRCKKALSANGIYISIDDGLPRSTFKDFIFLKELAESGDLKPVIDKVCQLEEMPQSHRYVEKGHKKGNLVISIKHDE